METETNQQEEKVERKMTKKVFGWDCEDPFRFLVSLQSLSVQTFLSSSVTVRWPLGVEQKRWEAYDKEDGQELLMEPEEKSWSHLLKATSANWHHSASLCFH